MCWLSQQAAFNTIFAVSIDPDMLVTALQVSRFEAALKVATLRPIPYIWLTVASCKRAELTTSMLPRPLSVLTKTRNIKRRPAEPRPPSAGLWETLLLECKYRGCSKYSHDTGLCQMCKHVVCVQRYMHVQRHSSPSEVRELLSIQASSSSVPTTKMRIVCR